MSGRNEQIPVMRAAPHWCETFEATLHDIWDSGQFSNFGPQVTLLEEKFGEKLGVDPSQVVSVANATLGLTGAMQIAAAERWLVPSWTFAATGHAALATGAQLILVDVNEASWMAAGFEHLSAGSGAVLVLPFGAGLDSFGWADDAKIVIDAAASIGAKLPALSALPEETAIVFSLHATKVIGVGEGGLVVFGSARAAEHFRSWTNFGFEGGRQSEIGATNAKMPEIIAGLNRLQLERWDGITDGWRTARANMAFAAETARLDFFTPSASDISPYFIAIFSDAAERNFAAKRLQDAGVMTRKWWADGLHKMPAFECLEREAMTNTEKIASRYLGLPLFPGLTADESAYICSSIARTS